MSTRTVTAIRHFNAKPEAVYDAWLDPAKARRFLFATPTGEVTQVDIDARVGGTFVIVDRRPGEGDVRHEGTYLQLERGVRLAFSFAVPQSSPDVTRVGVGLREELGGCDLGIIHTGVPEDWADQTKAGWEMILDNLAKVLG